MIHLFEFKEFKDPQEPYREENRRTINLDAVRRTKEYRRILSLGMKEDTSHQQELNNTMRFTRYKNKQKEVGYGDVFYTIHPTGTVRRYNPIKSEDGQVQEGSGNDLKRFNPFRRSRDYKKAMTYLYEYLKRKQERGDYR